MQSSYTLTNLGIFVAGFKNCLISIFNRNCLKKKQTDTSVLFFTFRGLTDSIVSESFGWLFCFCRFQAPPSPPWESLGHLASFPKPAGHFSLDKPGGGPLSKDNFSFQFLKYLHLSLFILKSPDCLQYVTFKN